MNVKTIGNDIAHHPAVAIGIACIIGGIAIVGGTAVVKAIRK
ncbi:hypothetical protein [Methanorbis rubei]